MGLATTLARRSLLQRPGRTLFAVLGIALGVATVVGIVVLDYNTVLGLARAKDDPGRPDIELRSERGEGSVEELREVEGMSLVTRSFQQDARLTVPGSDGGDPKLESVRLIGADAADLPSFDVWTLSEGRGLQAGGVPEVLLGMRAAEELGLALGDSVWLSQPPRPGRRECRDGKLVVVERGERQEVPELEFEVVGLLAREGLGRRSGGMVALVDYDAGARLYPGKRLRTVFWGRRDSDVDLERFERSLASSYSVELDAGVILGQAADERAFRTGVRLAGLLALVLGLYVIFHTLSMSLQERVREVGTLSALGATRGQVGRVFLLEALLLAGAGAALGILGGLGLAALSLEFGITTLGTGKHIPQFEVPWGVTLSLAGIGFFVALIGSVYPLSILGRADVTAALRGHEALKAKRVAFGFHLLYALLLALVLPALYLVIVPVVGEFTAELVSVLLGGVGFLALVVLLSLVMPRLLSATCAALTAPFTRLFPLAGRIAARTIRAAPARIGASAAAIALVTAGLVGLKGMTRSLAGEVDTWAAEAALDKVWLDGLPATKFETLAATLGELPGVLGVEQGEARAHAPFLIVGTDPAQLAGYGPCAEDPELIQRLEAQRTIILSRRLAQDLGYAVGDEVLVTKADGNVARYSVLAISSAYGHWPRPDERMYGVVATRWMEKDFCQDSELVTQLAVRLADGTPPAAAQAAVESVLAEAHPNWNGRLEVRTGEDLRDFHRHDIVRDFVLFDALILLTALLAGLGVLNGMLLAALEREGEIGILSALGSTRGQLGGTVLLEALVVGLVGGLLGALLGAGLSPLAVLAVERLAGLELPLEGAGPWLAVGLLGALLVSLLAALYPIWRLGRFDAVRAVRGG